MQYQWDIIGHQRQVQYLQNSIENGKINHAYLFYGPEHLGKKKIAESFLFSLFCVSETKARPCGRCQNCAQIRKNIHPDVHWLEPEADKKNTSIKQVRELIAKLQKKSLHQGYKVVLIKQASSLTLSASNALLKTLEEPAQKTVLVLLAEDLSTIPETITSRCQIIRFLPVSQKDIYDYLQTETDRDQALKITRLAHGKPGLAVEFLNKKNALKKHQEKIDTVNTLLSGSQKEKFKLADKIHRSKKSSQELSLLLDLATSYLRDQILNQHNLEKYTVNQIQSPNNKTQNITKKINQIEKAQELLKQNVQPKLILENIIINI